MRLRPLSGAEADVISIVPELERLPVKPSTFAPPSADAIDNQDGARLLADALRLAMRRGAGPFRSAAQLGVEPRAYQLVPLLMALKLDVKRLLIADDVGIGKTIEAGMILREMYDRGQIDRFAVICPPHLVSQWREELATKFDLDAVEVTASNARSLERGLPASQSLFEAYPYTIVSLDYIKADTRRDEFARACPNTVIVDEAHSCVGGDGGNTLARILAGLGQKFRVVYEDGVKGGGERQLNFGQIYTHRTVHVPHDAMDRFERLVLDTPDLAFGALAKALHPSRVKGEAMAHALICLGRVSIDLDHYLFGGSPVRLLPEPEFTSLIDF